MNTKELYDERQKFCLDTLQKAHKLGIKIMVNPKRQQFTWQQIRELTQEEIYQLTGGN